MRIFRRLRRKPRTPEAPPWFSRKQLACIEAYRTANPTAVPYRIFVKDNGGNSWITCAYPERRFHLSLLRRFENLPCDWEGAADLALRLSGLDEEQCALVRVAVATGAVPDGFYTLLITPEGFCLKECVGNFQAVTVAEATF